jgi:uncharacterized protein
LDRLAANQGNAGAQLNVGLLYGRGQGVKQDDREAERWFRLAAEQGETTAQINLGLLYAKGMASPQNYVEAYVWFSRALAQGRKDALVLRRALADKMTPLQIVEADKRLNETG